jgi:hypothetical protein
MRVLLCGAWDIEVRKSDRFAAAEILADESPVGKFAFEE